MTTTFETAQIGDRVYSLNFGWGTARPTITHPSEEHLIHVVFDNGKTDHYFLNGCLYYPSTIFIRDLYWGSPQIIAPEKPKRLIKIKRYFNFDKTEQYEIPYMTGSVDGYYSLEEALRNLNKKNYFCTKEIEFEIEE